MISRFIKFAFLSVLIVGGASEVLGQSDPSDLNPFPRGRRGSDSSRDIKAMLAKQRLERQKKDHQRMLDRGEEALRLAAQLEGAFIQKKALTSADKARLETLQDLVEKIRKDLGGDDDDGAISEVNIPNDEGDSRPSTMEEAFTHLKETTGKLVEELQRTTRFTISAIAIQTSNSVIRLVKFLRLRK
jgi:hypothetical protein